MKTLVLVGADGSRIRIRSNSLVGSGPSADLLVCGAGVQAAHARLCREAGGWYVRAQKGRVLRNDTAVEAAPLRAGDRLTLGSARFQVESIQSWPPRSLAIGLASLAVGLLAILVAQPAHPDGTVPQIELPTDGVHLRWKGESRVLVLHVPVVDPRRVDLELRVHQEENARPFDVVVGGVAIAHRKPEASGPISLRGHLEAGTNEIRLVSGAGPLEQLSVAAVATPIPNCLHADCATPLQSASERAARLEREKAAAPGNLFEAWRLLRGARGLAIGLGARDEEASIVRRITGVEAALDARCAALEFAAARHLALADVESARTVADRILASFPGREHRCHASGERLLAIVGRGR